MTQSFRAIKRDPCDVLFSQIIRYGRTQCQGCYCRRSLQACHIFGRGAKSTRWTLEPKPDAIALCSTCHSRFDSMKDKTPIFHEKARRYAEPQSNSFAFLVSRCGYTWEDLQKLYVMAHTPFHGYKHEIPRIKAELKAHLEKLKNGGVSD